MYSPYQSLCSHSTHDFIRRDPRYRFGRRSFALILLFGFSTLSIVPSAAASDWRTPFACDPQSASGAEPGEGWRHSDAAYDLYNGLTFLSAAGAITFAGEPSRRWSGVNALDAGARDGLRLGSTNERRDAALGSDVALGLSVAALPILSMVAHQSRTQDCAETVDMFTDFVESFGLTLMITQSVKLASGRTRPYTRDCAPRDASCGDDDRFQSFISGHAGLAATGAGLTCAFSIKKQAWGSSLMQRAAPCGFGIATALTAGTLRIASDRHWVTDVAVGFAVGAVVGYFDTWGPFDLLKFKKQDAKGRTTALGILSPARIDGHFGAQFVMIF